MIPLIVVSSKTGNTRLIARALQDAFGACSYVEAVRMPADLSNYNPIVLCFWCDRGMAPADIQAAASRLQNKDVACFATMGDDPEKQRSQDWLQRTSCALAAAGEGNALRLKFLCRGRIDPALLEHLAGMTGDRTQAELLSRSSETHPDRLDTLAAVKAYREVFGD